MSNELLRIHDENNNCDLVAVANPMGNFHMSTYAEMQDGTQKPVDGWYLFSKMIEKLGQGGGEQPESGPLVVTFTYRGGSVTCDKTFEEVNAAFPNVITYVDFIELDDDFEEIVNEVRYSVPSFIKTVELVGDRTGYEFHAMVTEYDINSSNQITFYYNYDFVLADYASAWFEQHSGRFA